MKKFVSIIISLVMFLLPLQTPVFAADVEYLDDLCEFSYSVEVFYSDAALVRICGTGEMPDFKSAQLEHINNNPNFNSIKVIVEEGITHLGSNLFSGMNKLSEVELPATLASIGKYTFNGCSSLKSISIPKSVNTINPYAFDNCTSLQSFSVDKYNNSYTSYDDILYSADLTHLVKYPQAKQTSSTFVSLPETEVICEKAFCECVGISSVILQNNVKFVCEKSFYNSSVNTVKIMNDKCELNGEYIFSNNCKIIASDESYAYKYALQNNLSVSNDFQTEDVCHNFVSTTVAPTCQHGGYTKNECTICGKVVIENQSDPSNHRFKTITKSATQTATGYSKTYCIDCNFVKTYSVIPKLANKVSLPATKITKLSPSKKAITVKWKSKKSITGYQIVFATNSKFTKNKKTVTVKGSGKTGKKVSSLKSKKTYYVKIRTYKVINGKKYYSSWSAVKKVKTK